MHPSGDLDPFLARHSVFIRKSRDVSRQSLYFLGLLTRTNSRKTDKKLGKFARFVLVKIQAFVNGVHVQIAYFTKKAEATSSVQTQLAKTGLLLLLPEPNWHLQPGLLLVSQPPVLPNHCLRSVQVQRLLHFLLAQNNSV